VKANDAAARRVLSRCVGPVFFSGLLWWCGGCGGGSDCPPPPPGMPQTLLVGPASGAVLQTIQSQYETVPGNGNEDPTPYAMIIFDGDNTTPAQLQTNPGVQSFLLAGKPVVILHDVEAHRSSLTGVWAHAQGLAAASPAVAFVLRQGRNGAPQQLAQVDFPLYLRGLAPGQESLLPLTPTADQVAQDSPSWLQAVLANENDSDNIVGATCGSDPENPAPSSECINQAVYPLDYIVPLRITMPTVLEYATQVSGGPPYGTLWGPNNSEPPSFSTTITGTFETHVYAALEGSGGAYQHKIFARQYLSASPPDSCSTDDGCPSFTVVQCPTFGSCDGWNDCLSVPSQLGWNSEFTLTTEIPNPPVTLVVSEFMPEAENDVVTLTTSQQQSESVGVSATAGIRGLDPEGQVGTSWTHSWSWGESEAVEFQDWQSVANQATGENPGAAYTFCAFAGSQITNTILNANALDIPWNDDQLNSFTGLNSGNPDLNALQVTAMANQSETVWTTTGMLLPSGPVSLTTGATVTSGELLQVFGNVGDCGNSGGPFTSWSTAPISVDLSLNFATPGLQPAAWNAALQQQLDVDDAPWTLSFTPWPQPVPPNATITGEIALNSPRTSDTTINLTYVLQPQATMDTWPPEEACTGNVYSFIPGPNVINDGTPPLRVTIPAGVRSVRFPLTFQTFNENNYNVQVVAWQTETIVNGQTIINPQYAQCLTVPNTTIGG
jgi:hypothetical protein